MALLLTTPPLVCSNNCPSSSSSSSIPRHGLRISCPPLLISLSPPSRLSMQRPSAPNFILARAVAAPLPVLTFDGEASGETQLNLKTARPDTARAVVHRGVITELQNRRRGTASTLTRGEVRGGGRKPYGQKKTGRARRGSQRTPLRVGGGVIFGPKPKDWSIRINKKEKQLAISTALQSAVGSVVVIEDFEDKITVPKTKDFIAAMKRWGVDPTEPSLLFTTNATENLVLSSRNVGTFKLITPRSLNLHDILKARKLMVTKSGIDYLNQQYGVQTEDSDSGAAVVVE